MIVRVTLYSIYEDYSDRGVNLQHVCSIYFTYVRNHTYYPTFIHTLEEPSHTT